MRDYDFHNLNVYEANKLMDRSDPHKRWQPRSRSRWLAAAVIVVVGGAALFGEVKLIGVLLDILRSGM